jgi:hypothetical protein
MKNINIITEAKVQKGDNIFAKYTGNMWSVGTALILAYWIAMFGMVINAHYNQDIVIDGASLNEV